MPLHKKHLKSLATLLLFSLSLFFAHAQKITAKDTTITVQDTIVSNIVNKVEKYNFAIKQTRSNTSQIIKIRPLMQELIPLQKGVTAMQNILDSAGRFMNLRRLNTFSIMLDEFGSDLNDHKETLNDYYQRLKASNDTIAKIANDTTLNVMVADSGLEKQIRDVRWQAGQMDKRQKDILARITVLRNKVSLSLLQVRDMVSTVSFRTKNLKRKMWKVEDLPLFKDKLNNFDQSIFSLFGTSLSRTGLITGIYLSKHWNMLTIAIVFFLFVIIWTWSNMHRVKNLPERDEVLAQMYFLRPRTVTIGGLLAMFIFLPFLFGDPPMSVVHLCEICRTIIVTFILYPYLSRQPKKLWLIFCLVWLYLVFDDLLVDSALSERWMLMIMSIIYTWFCIKILLSKGSFFTKISDSPITKTLTIFCLVQILLSIFFNLTGRITLTKMLSVSAVECLMLGVTLRVFCSLILEAVYLQSEAYRQSRLSEYINYQQLERKFKRILWIAAIAIWLVSLLRDWGMYSGLIDGITFFFVKVRTLGSHHFNFGDIALFIGIIWLSVIISSIINFFFGQNDNTKPANRKGIASMMLLIRLAVWTIGFMIAVAAAGIPLTQLTVMLGALSVGIGFGLQNIANNLVSGIILAFERPIQVGDQIEIGGKNGIVKEIGVRSSKLDPGNGADIIIPNGDLLSQQLTNWTMKNWAKISEFTIGISYDNDIVEAQKIIIETLREQENVLKEPAPYLMLHSFADEAFELKVSFWVSNLLSAGTTRGKVMANVYKALQEHNIKLPYPILRFKEFEKGKE